MADYVDSVLGRGESVLYQARVSLASYWVMFLAAGFFLFGGLPMLFMGLFSRDPSTSGMSGMGLGIIVFGCLFLLPPLIAYMTTELAITDRRIIAKVGLISRSTIEVNISKIESIRVDQSILGRIFNYGDIFVVGTGGSKEPIRRVSRPILFRQKFGDALANQEAKKVA